MQVQYQLTAEDFWQSTLAWRKARTGRRWSFRLLPMFCILLLTLSVISVWQNPQYRTSTPILVVGAFLMVAAWMRPRLNARRAYNMPSNHGPMVLEVSDSGLHFRSAVEDSKLSWSAFIGWAEGSVVFALFPSPRTSLPIPKRAFSPEQLIEFRGHLHSNIKEDAGN